MLRDSYHFSNIRLIFFFVSLAPLFTSVSLAEDKIQFTQYVVWSETNHEKHQLLFLKGDGSHWSNEPILIAESSNPIITPSFVVRNDGSSWFVWTELDRIYGSLMYRIKDKGKWSQVRNITTNTSSDMAPSISLDSKRQPWLTWSGTGNNDDDIFYSHWLDNRWQKPLQVNTDDEWPDILPTIERDEENRMLIKWSGYNGQRYIKYFSYWTGSEWSKESVVEHTLKKGKALVDIDLTELPDIIPEGTKGYLFDRISQSGIRFTKRRDK